MRDNLGLHLLRVPVSHLREVFAAAHDGFLVEEIAGLGAQFAAYDLIIYLLVALDIDMAEMSLLSLDDADLDVYRVTYDLRLDRLNLVEYISVVVVEIAHCVVVRMQAFLELGLIVYSSSLEGEQTVKELGRIDRVADPCKVVEIVLLALVYIEIDIDVLLIIRHYAVTDYVGVAIAPLIVFLDDVFLILCVLFSDKFL